jgi:hypothetical protein
MAKKVKKPAKAKKKETPAQVLKRMTRSFQDLKNTKDFVLHNSEDWSDPVRRGTVANEVLSFGPETADQSDFALGNYGFMLRRAFRATGMNPDNPYSWHFLIRMFAFIHFGPTDKENKYAAMAMKVRSLIASGEKNIAR